MNFAVSFDDIRSASERIEPFVHRTPILTSSSLDTLFGARLFFKCENLQITGAFKYRGATNAVLSLSKDEAEIGVAAHSSGNHGAALAKAATNRGIRSWIVMPEDANPAKCKAVLAYGGELVRCEPGIAGRESKLSELVDKTGATFIHPSNDARVIAGQGTAALELLEDVSDLDLVLTPIGGGGLVSGTALVVAHLSPDTHVIGTEPAGADDAARSFISGHIEDVIPDTIADGLHSPLGNQTLPIILEHVNEVVTVADSSIVEAMRLVWQRMKILIEPSSAVPIAALLEKKIDVSGQRVGIILSGGNVDLDKLPW